jgi:hypothetical protein
MSKGLRSPGVDAADAIRVSAICICSMDLARSRSDPHTGPGLNRHLRSCAKATPAASTRRAGLQIGEQSQVRGAAKIAGAPFHSANLIRGALALAYLWLHSPTRLFPWPGADVAKVHRSPMKVPVTLSGQLPAPLIRIRARPAACPDQQWPTDPGQSTLPPGACRSCGAPQPGMIEGAPSQVVVAPCTGNVTPRRSVLSPACSRLTHLFLLTAAAT